MSKLLFIQASPRGTESKSNQIAEAYVTALREQSTNLVVDVLPLWNVKLPTFDGDKVSAKIATLQGKQHTANETTAWDEIVAIADRFHCGRSLLDRCPDVEQRHSVSAKALH